MDKAVLAAASHRTDSRVHFVDFCDVSYGTNTKKVFFCVAEHECSLLRKSFSRLVTGAKFYYEDIDKVVTDLRTDSCILIKFKTERSPHLAEDRMYIMTMQRDNLIKHIDVCYRASIMASTYRPCKLPIYEDKLPKQRRNHELPSLEPFIGFQVVQYEGYSFFLDDGFEDRATSTGSSGTGQYVDARRIEVAVHVHDPFPLRHLADVQRDSLRHVADEYRRGLTTNTKHFHVAENRAHFKKMNLADDIASWCGWEICIQSTEALIACILLRRSYVPPLLDTCQDIAIIFRIDLESAREMQMTMSALRRECHLTADSLSTITQTHVWYKNLVQNQCDCLVYDAKSYQWLEWRLKTRPCWQINARALLLSILKLFESENVLADSDLVLEANPENNVPVIDDPTVAINQIVQNPVGFDLSDNSDFQLSCRNEWAIRVSRYLALSLNGWLLAGKFSLLDIVTAIPRVSAAARKKLDAVLEFLLHMRPNDMTKPFDNGVFRKKIADGSGFSDYSFNDSVLAILFETEYVSKLFPQQGGEGAYVAVMGLFLMSPTSSLSLKTAICKQVLEATRYELFEDLLPSIANLVKPSTGAYHPILASYATAVLVNLSASKSHVKSMLLNAGVAPVAVQHLRSEDEDTVQLTLKLCVNLTKNSTHRQRFASAGIVSTLVDMLVREHDTPHENKYESLGVIVALLGQLANDNDTRDLLVVKYPVMECVLYLYHNVPAQVDLKTKTMFCLKQLAGAGWQARQRIGKHVIPSLLTNLRSQNDGTFIVTALALLQALCQFKPNCVDANDASAQEALQDLMSRLPTDVIVDRAMSVASIIAKHVRFVQLDAELNA
eukprot:Lankesteria_metandrocarpae@DN927_c0_g1_i1.p1